MNPQYRNLLIDACVMMDVLLTFRERYGAASRLFQAAKQNETRLHVPAHAWFEYTVTTIVHFKAGDVVDDSIVNRTLSHDFAFNVIALDNQYVQSLLKSIAGRPVPDLKSQDLIYFCIASEKGFPLVTEDAKLRRIAKSAGITAITIDEAEQALNYGK
jgi:predicted nucleic acid-binding protein